MSTAKGPAQIILIGDSLTEYGGQLDHAGWAIALTSLYTRKMDVINRGLAGYTSEWVKYLLSQLLPPTPENSPTVALVIIFIGANDSVLASELQHTPLEGYKQNLREMASTVRKHNTSTRLLFVAPPPFDDGAWEETCAKLGRKRQRDVKQTALYSRACLEVAKELNIPAVDLWTAFTEDPRPHQDLFCDGLHMTRNGNYIILSQILMAIKTAWPELDPEALTPILPYWRDVDTSNLKECMRLSNPSV